MKEDELKERVATIRRVWSATFDLFETEADEECKTYLKCAEEFLYKSINVKKQEWIHADADS